MQFIQFQDVEFSYPPIEGDLDQDGKQIIPLPIFQHLTAELPGGFVSLVGPNASGKSTLMLLAAGRILPQQGKVFLLGKDTSTLTEDEREKLASFIYQNMEFESQETVSELLDYVYKNGCFAGNGKKVVADVKFEDQNQGVAFVAAETLIAQVNIVLELQDLMEHRLTELSKGEMQRVILAFSLLYGSQSIFMDEPLFAMETAQKHRALAFVKGYCKTFGITVYVCMHELELNRMYPENILLFYPNRDMDFGTPEEVLTQEALEKAYGVPVAMLKDSEALTRKTLQEQYEPPLE
ncbi:MAG: ABC transporter ATP-binding protein [Spirochaetaceae bacterium]|nr:ABC transporter ATP-binding protein [Spirochaetaceae bacterium]